MHTSPVRRLSFINAILAAILFGATATSVIRGEYGLIVVLVITAAYVGFTVHRARRGRGSVNERVSAFQPYDERDRELLDRSYSVLGQAVFAAQSVVFLWAVFTNGDAGGEALRLLAICAIAIIATTITVRRG